jgi:putative FmdB family regulatory protein
VFLGKLVFGGKPLAEGKMPLYEYRCDACNAKEERLDSFSSPTVHDCPACGKEGGMVRLLSVPSISFAGGGWYAQGYSDTPPCKTEKPKGKEQSSGNGSGKSPCEDCAHNRQAPKK